VIGAGHFGAASSLQVQVQVQVQVQIIFQQHWLDWEGGEGMGVRRTVPIDNSGGAALNRVSPRRSAWFLEAPCSAHGDSNRRIASATTARSWLFESRRETRSLGTKSQTICGLARPGQWCSYLHLA